MRYAIKTPHVYIDGIGTNRFNIAASFGDSTNSSKKLRDLEIDSFRKVAEEHPHIVQEIKRMHKSSLKGVRDLGEIGALELVGKLGIFLALIPDVDIYRG